MPLPVQPREHPPNNQNGHKQNSLVGKRTSGSKKRPQDNTEIIDALKHKIIEMEGRRPEIDRAIIPSPNVVPRSSHAKQTNAGQSQSSVRWCFGIEDIDDALPDQKLSQHALHEILPQGFSEQVCAPAFALSLVARLFGQSKPPLGPVIWCRSSEHVREFGDIHADGLAAFGISSDRLIIVNTKRNAESLWALEEASRCRAVAAVIGEVGGISFTQTRRLAIGCAAGHTPLLLIRPHNDASASAAATRWRIGATTSAADVFDKTSPGNPRWRVDLMRCRGGRSGTWHLEFNHATHHFSMATPLADRAAGSDDNNNARPDRQVADQWRQTAWDKTG